MAVSRERLLRKSPSILGIVAFLIAFHGWFYVASTPASTALFSLASMAYPFSVFAATAMLLRFQAVKFTRRETGWPHIIIFFAGFLGIVVLGLALGTGATLYANAYKLFGGDPLGAAGCMLGWTLMLTLSSSFRARNWGYGAMVFILILSLLGFGLLGEIIWLPLTDISTWVTNNIANPGMISMWLCVYIGFATVAVRAITLRQSLGGLE